MTLFTPVTATEHDNLVAWIANGLANARSIGHGLTMDQLTAMPVASSELSLAWLLLHVADVAEGWSARAAAGPDGTEDDHRPVAERFAAESRSTAVPDGADADWLFAEYDARVARALATLETVDLDATSPVPDMPWYQPGLPPFPGRWCLLHLYSEIQRHSGHADLLREAIDGRTMYDLIAADQGESLDYMGAWFAAHPEVPAPW